MNTGRGLSAAAVLAATALGAVTFAVPAGAATTKYKVVSGGIKQVTQWESDSQSDNGCYTGTFTDTGTTTVNLKANRGAIVSFVRSGYPAQGPQMLKGLKFSGTVQQSGQFPNKWDADSGWEPYCGPSTGPFYEEPSTAGCGTAKIAASKSNVTLVGPASPALMGSFYTTDPLDNCPSDDPVLATEPALAQTGQKAAIWKRRTIKLKASAQVSDTDGMYFRGNDAQVAHRHATIEWSLTLVRVAAKGH
jgi:hypothetical protein